MNRKKQTLLDIPKVIAVGISAPVATILTSRFGVAGTLIGLALSAVILTALADLLKIYLAQAPATIAKVPVAVAKMPGGLQARLSWRNVRSRLRAPFAGFSSLPPAPARRRSILIGSGVAAGVSFFVGLIIVTGLEQGVGKSLSCWLWSDCPEESSTDDGGSLSRTSTLPSMFGGSSSARSSTPEVRSVDPQQQQPALPDSPESPLVSPSAAPFEAPGTEAQGSDASDPGQDQSTLWEEDQQQNLPDYSEEDQQQSPPNASKEERSSRSQDSGQNTRSPASSVPWTT